MNLSNNVVMDTACCFARVSRASSYDVSKDGVHNCLLKCATLEGITDGEFEDLLSIGCPIRNRDDVTVYRIALIMDKHFKSGEWGMSPRCGSVITLVLNGRSVYARVLKFIKSDGEDACPGYASVCWFSEPTYINSLCPRVTLDGSNIHSEIGTNVIRITQIQPSQVCVELVPSSDVCFMLRDSGYDKLRN